MAKIKRYNVALDDETVELLALWRSIGVSGSAAIREAVKAYTRWKKPTPNPETFDGVDITYNDL